MSVHSQVIADITMSVDGYVTAPGADPDHGLGVGGEMLHNWVMGSDSQDQAQLDTMTARTGAVIMGRKTFDVVDGPKGWSDTMGYGAHHNAIPPVFVVTHSAPERWRLGDRFRFATNGLADTLDQARAAAGERDVVIMGGGAVINAFLVAGLVDVLKIHLAPVVLGGGSPLFAVGQDKPAELELIESVSTAAAQHLTYRVVRSR